MSSAPSLTELLSLYKPPFHCAHDGYIFDADHNMVLDNVGEESFARVRGWGRLQYLPKAEELQDALGALFAEALNEYWEKHLCR